LLPSAVQVVHRLGDIAAATIVIGQHVIVLRQALDKELLDGLGSAPMQHMPSLLQQTPIGHLVGEGVFEGVCGGREPPRLIEELGGLEVAEVHVELCCGEVSHGLEEQHGDSDPDDGSSLQGTWKLWLMTRGDQFRPEPPPALDSAECQEELALLKRINSSPTPSQRALATNFATKDLDFIWEPGNGLVHRAPLSEPPEAPLPAPVHLP